MHAGTRHSVCSVGFAPAHRPSAAARARPASRPTAGGGVLRLRADLPLERQREVRSGALVLHVAPPSAARGAQHVDPRRSGSLDHRLGPPTGRLRGDGAPAVRRVVALRPTGRLRARRGPPHRGPQWGEEPGGAGVLLEHGLCDAAPPGNRGPSARRAAGAITSAACLSPATTSATRWSAPATNTGTRSGTTTRTPIPTRSRRPATSANQKPND